MDVLARSLADGGTEALLATCDAYADRLYAYSTLLLADEASAATAVHDALRVAAERATWLREPARLGPWLYALTRNECLRRRPSRSLAGQQRERVELAVRHRLGVEDIAAVLGLDAVDVADSVAAAALRPVDPLPAAPPALRVRLADPAGDDPAGLARRAGPFRPDGFPQPLDRRRLSGRVLAACIAVPVLGTLALLTAVPGDSPSASGAALAGTGTVTRAAVQAGGPAAQPSSWPVPRPAPATSLRPPDSPPASAAPSTAAAPATRTGAGPRSAPLADRDSAGAAVSGWVENLTAPACPTRWTARVHVMVVGTDAQQVVATWFDGEDVRTVSLRHRDRDWVGELSRIPAGKQLWWRAGAVAEDGTIAGTGQQSLGYDCAR